MKPRKKQKINGSKSELYQEKPGGHFKEGNPGGGRTSGTRDFNTDFDEVVEEIAKSEKKTVSEVRKVLLKVAYLEAARGDFYY